MGIGQVCNRQLFLVGLCLVMTMGWLCIAGSKSVYAAGGVISGTVTDAEGNGLDNIGVNLYADLFGQDLWTPIGIYAMTDQTGQYAIVDVEPGIYRLGFRDGRWPLAYATTYHNNVVRVEDASDVTVTAAQTSTVNAQLASTMRIEGVVIDTDNKPLADIQVSLWMRDPAQPNAWMFTNQQTTTASNGAYELAGIDTGRYRLSFTDTRLPHQYSTEYYDNTTLAQGTDIVVPGGAVRVINAQLAGVGALTGLVTAEDGTPLPGIRISATTDPEGDDNWQNKAYRPSAVTTASGHYTMTGVEAGTNRVCFTDDTAQYADECYADQPTISRATDITMSAGITRTVDAQLAARGGISGTIVDAQSQPLAFYQVLLYIDPEDDGNWIADANHWTTADATGTYTLTGLNPDTYRVKFGDPSGQFNAPEFYSNTLTVAEAVDVVVLPAQITPNINARLAPYSHITGMVTDAQNNPLQNVRVSVYRADLDVHSLPFGQPFTSADTNQAGQYNVTGLVAGQYYVEFADPFNNLLHTTYYADAGYLMTATPITVSRAMTATDINAQLLPVAAINYPPFATADQATVRAGRTTKIIQMPWGPELTVLINDRDAESMPLTVTLVSTPTHGAVTLATTGMFTYTHDGSKTTQDFFTYRLFDGVHHSNIATVTVDIIPVFDELLSLEFTKTVWIANLPVPCGSTATLRVPISTTVAYCYTLRNSGNVTVTEHTLTDDQLGTILLSVPYTLTPGATHSVLMTQTIALTTTNVATWTARVASLQTRPAFIATDTATVTLSTATDDQDGDGIPDVTELAGDIDHDNLPNFLDPDADGDSLTDRAESGTDPLTPKDSNDDGLPDYLDPFTPYRERLYLPLTTG